MHHLRFLVKGWYDWVAMAPQQPQSPNAQAALQTADAVLHGVVFAAILAAGIFVKNPNSQVMAGKLSDLAVQLLNQLDAQAKSQGA